MNDKFRQFDILALYKMCRELGLVKGNIKTLRDYENKELYHKRIGKKLLRKIIIHLFPGLKIRSRSYSYEIIFNNHISYLIRRNPSISDSYYAITLRFGKSYYLHFYESAVLCKSLYDKIKAQERMEMESMPVPIEPVIVVDNRVVEVVDNLANDVVQPVIQPEQNQTIQSSQDRFNLSLANLIRNRQNEHIH